MSDSPENPGKDNGGRPPFVPTKPQRETVATAAGGGMSHEEIAIGLGISRPTLEKHFAAELSTGAYRKRLDVYNAMRKAAMKGNVAAQKAYLAMGEPHVAPPPAPLPEKPEKPLGKKEQADVDARAAATGTEWGSILKPGSDTVQ